MLTSEDIYITQAEKVSSSLTIESNGGGTYTTSKMSGLGGPLATPAIVSNNLGHPGAQMYESWNQKTTSVNSNPAVRGVKIALANSASAAIFSSPPNCPPASSVFSLEAR